jgi:hypothetical protein
MKIGIGGSAGGVRAGVSNRGVGAGVGPLSAGKSFRGRTTNSGGDTEDAINTVLFVLGVLAAIIFGPLALLFLAYCWFRAGKRVVSALLVAAAIAAAWASFTYILRPSYVLIRYYEQIPTVRYQKIDDAVATLHDAGFSRVVVQKHRAGDYCYVNGSSPVKLGSSADVRKTVHLELWCREK